METTISKLFDSKNRRFKIPSYQRSYSWGEKEILQFIEDLVRAESHYYLGHYLFEIDGDNTFLVIDGQQRLTTCIIFFSVLRKELTYRLSMGEILDNCIDPIDLNDYYLKDTRKEVQKFETVSSDNNFFLREIIESKNSNGEEPGTKSQERIRTARLLFESAISSANTSDLLKWCKLIEDASITQYVVKDKIQATQIFAFQNDRGKKLSNLEILKAYLMLQIYLSGSSKEHIESAIKYLEKEFTCIYQLLVKIECNEDEVLNYYWRSVSDRGYNSEPVIKGVKSIIGTISSSKIEWIQNFIYGLTQAFLTVEKIESAQDQPTQDLRYLNNMALSYPFLIKAFRLRTENTEIQRIVRLLENLTFRISLRGGRADIESRLTGYLKGMTEGGVNSMINNIIFDLKNNGWWSYWSDASIKQILDGWLYNNPVDNYLLWKYELSICNSDYPLPPLITFNDLIKSESIEHIAPQTATNAQPEANNYGIYKDLANPEIGIESGQWLNRIGNLMLISLSQNCSLGNKHFLKKLAVYGNSNLLNQQKEIKRFVTDPENPVWDKFAIERRQNAIVESSMKTWSLDYI